MAPLHFDGSLFFLVNLLIGFGFGFTLERAGFGDSRKLAAQFYFTDMTVLKVMFTAIVTAMVVVHVAWRMGLVDLSLVWINPTFLWSAIAGGLILGAGFIIGGYCPGTSLVGAATLKLDAMFFVLGVLLGIFAFGEVVPRFWDFYQLSGAMGRVTLADWMGRSTTTVVFLVSLLAVFMFWGGHQLEHAFGPGARRGPLARRLQPLAAALLVGGALVLASTGDPGPETLLRHRGPELDARLANGEVQVEPEELLALMHDRSVRLRIVDLRDEAAWNWFHLLDAERLEPDAVTGFARDLDYDEIVILVDAEGDVAPEAWRLLQAAGARNSYLLEGGLAAWLERFSAGIRPAAALGDRHPAAWPELPEGLEYTSRVERVGPAPVVSGGCG